MANFNNMVLTEKGQVLYAKGQAGVTINFTKLAVGIGAVGTKNPETLTDLVTHKFDIAIQGKTVNTLEKVALISGTLTNSNMTESVYIQEIGLYALDPDDGEILYSYASAGQFGDYTSPASNGPYAWNYQIYAAIGNAANVNVTLSGLQYDTGIVNTNTTFSVIKGSNQKEINKSIDNKLKPYTTVNSGNIYTITSSDIDALTDGYPILVRFNEASTGEISLVVNNSIAHDIVDYFGNKVSSIRNGLVAHLVFDENNSNFQLLGKGGEGDATKDQVLIGKRVTVNGGLLVGTMPDNNIQETDLPINGDYIIPKGYHPGTEVITQSITTKAGATYSPSTIQQVISAGQYLTNDQIIAAITGTATDSDVVAGKTYNSAAGILRTGTASVRSLGGFEPVSGTKIVNVPSSTSRFYLDLEGDINFIPTVIYGTVGSYFFVRTPTWMLCYDLYKDAYNTSNMSGVPAKGAALGEGDTNNHWGAGDYTVNWTAIG